MRHRGDVYSANGRDGIDDRRHLNHRKWIRRSIHRRGGSEIRPYRHSENGANSFRRGSRSRSCDGGRVMNRGAMRGSAHYPKLDVAHFGVEPVKIVGYEAVRRCYHNAQISEHSSFCMVRDLVHFRRIDELAPGWCYESRGAKNVLGDGVALSLSGV